MDGSLGEPKHPEPVATKVATHAIAGLGLMLAYLAFVYTMIGFANDSRYHWEDLVQGNNGVAVQGLKIQPKDWPIDRAQKQAKRDFHDWYGSFFFANSFAMLLVLALAVAYISTHIVGARRHVVLALTDAVLLVLFALAVVLSHVFAAQAYNSEVVEVLQGAPLHRWGFPTGWF